MSTDLRWNMSPRRCEVCDSKDCEAGAYLPVLADPLRQRWVCRCCVVKASSAFVIEHVIEGTLRATRLERARVGDGSLIPCTRAHGCACAGLPMGTPPKLGAELTEKRWRNGANPLN